MNKILIVEDDMTLCEELSILLKNAGYEVLSIKVFKDLLSQMKEADADLILLDISLPEETARYCFKNIARKRIRRLLCLQAGQEMWMKCCP